MVPFAEWMPLKKRQKKNPFIWTFGDIFIFLRSLALRLHLPAHRPLLATGLLLKPLVFHGWHCVLAHLSLCDFGWGFACKQEGKWNWWTEIGAPVCVGRAPWSERRAPGVGGPHGYRVSLPANRWQPLGECWVSQNLEVPCSDGKAPGAVQLSTPFPAVFPHLCICCKTEWRLLWLVFALVTWKNKPFCSPVFLPFFSLCLLPAPPFLTWPGACRISLISINSDTSECWYRFFGTVVLKSWEILTKKTKSSF